ncbi:MAG: OmpH family outer membrane protein [Alphaproteobacteria bacterium]|nr:OmpH family outer membrane protein [Alphaproteobacteria bacterium]
MSADFSIKMASRFIAGLALLVLAVVPVDSAQAQYSGGVGVVDMDFVLKESTAMTSAREQLDAISARYRDEISGEEESLRSRDAALEQQRGLLAPEAYNEQAVALQRDIEALDQKIITVQRALDELFQESVIKIQQVLIDQISALAGERGLTLVIPLNSILYASEFFNITDDALARLNEVVPRVELEIEEIQEELSVPE